LAQNVLLAAQHATTRIYCDGRWRRGGMAARPASLLATVDEVIERAGVNTADFVQLIMIPASGWRQRLDSVAHRCSFPGSGAMNAFVRLDRTLDDVLVQLGGIVLRLSHPGVTRTPEERHALVLSVNQYAVCAALSNDPRVHQLRIDLEATLKPRLRLVARR
jgi:hypothetical protein